MVHRTFGMQLSLVEDGPYCLLPGLLAIVLISTVVFTVVNNELSALVVP